MSYPELMNWDPMAEDYRKNISKPPENLSNDIDPLCLHVRQIPADFTEERFSSLMGNGGREVTRVMIKKISVGRTYGFVYFATHEDALLALNELNGTPPLYLQVRFSNRKKDEDKREIRMNNSRGRGKRIDIDGSMSISQKLTVTAGGHGRIVTVKSPEKKPDSAGFTSPCQIVEKSKAFQSEVSPQKLFNQKTDGSVSLTSNPYCLCFCCGKKAQFACDGCKKPYCSGSCQTSDWITHKRYCREIKVAAEALIKAYKSHSEALDSSYLSESSNSDFEKSQECSDVKKLIVSPGKFEKVSVTNINSPSKFWVHLKTFSGDFSKLETELSLLQKNFSLQNISLKNNLLCCAVYKNKIYRGRILKEKPPNEAIVFLLDYGETITTPKNTLFYLPEESRKLPAQAVCCKLVDETMKEDIDWNVEDILSFQLHASGKTYKAHILRCVKDIYEVSLINQDGISLFSILAEEKKSVPCVPELSVSINDGIPPSVWSKLKPDTQVNLEPIIPDGNALWCYLLTNGNLDRKDIIETEELLKKHSGKDISMCVEEGDFAAGFSVEYKQFYRCVVLKRKRSSFSVRYIDYGNEEEVSEVCSLSEQLLKKYSYAVKCIKPTSLNLEQLADVLRESRVQITVRKVSNDTAELAFNYQGEHIMSCYPCYPCNMNSESKENAIAKQEMEPKSCERKNLFLNHTYKVKIVFFKSVSEVYVQLMDDESKINKLLTDMNNYHNSKITRHIPVIGEIIGCKFSDEMWYRGLVKEEKEDTYHVVFIDYGDEHEVRPNDIQALPEKFKCPEFAICVSLSEIKNEHISQCLLSKLLEEIWDMKVISRTNVPEVIFSQKGCSLKQIIKDQNSSKKCKTSLKFKKIPIGITLDVKVCFEDGQFVYLQQAEDIKALDELCIQLNSVSKLPVSKIPIVGDVFCGLFTDGLWYRISIEEKISPDTYKVYFLDYGNYANLSVNDLRELPSDLFALPVFCMPVIIQNRKYLTPNEEEIYTVKTVGKNSEALEVMFLGDKKEDSLKAKTNKTNIDKINKTNLKFQKLSSDVNVDVKISFEDNKFMYLHQTKDVKSLEELCIQLNSLHELPVPQNLVVGNVYCGLCSDSLWYRVSVEEEVSLDTYKVLFLDYGNYENIPRTNLRELPHDLFALPVYCIPVTVENRKDLDLSMDEQYAVKVTGMNGEIQTVEFLLHTKENSLVCNTENQAKNKIDLIFPKNQDSLKAKANKTNIDKINKTNLKFQKLSSDFNVDVKISFEDNKFMYLHQTKDVKSLEELCIQLNSLHELPVAQNLAVGNVYCGLCSDSLWYRVSVEEEVSFDTYKVLFLDYGNYENIPRTNLRELPHDLFALPVYCIPVIVENRKDLDLSMDEQYAVKVTGMNGEIQTVEFLLHTKEENSLVCNTENQAKNKMDKIDLIFPKNQDSLKAKANKTNIDKINKTNLKFQKLSSDVNVDVKISFEDNKFLYLHQTKDVKSLEELCIQLNSLHELPVAQNLAVGNVYCGLCSDSLWYRVSVEEEVSLDTYKVLFLDYGNYENIPRTNLRELPHDLFALPVYCIPVTVENRKDLDLSMDEQYAVKVTGMNGETQTIEFLLHSKEEKPMVSNTEYQAKNKMNKTDLIFKKLPVECNVNVKISHQDEKYIYIHQVTDINALEELSIQLNSLSNLKTPKNPCINDVYCGLFIDGLWYRVSIEEIVSPNMYKVFFLDYGNYYNVSLNDLRELPRDLFTLPIYCIPVIIKNREMLPLIMEKNYIISVISFVKDIQEVEFTLQCEEKAKLPHISSLKRKQLKDGLNEVKILWVDEDVYYCQLSSDDDDVLTIFNDLQKCPKERSPAELSVGDVICAQSSDGCWYRASVLSNRNASSLKVNLLDYGNTEYVTSDCIRFLPKELLKQPTFAIPVKIENIQDIQNPDILTEPLTVENIKVIDENVHVVKVRLETESTAPEISETEFFSAEKDRKVSEIEPRNEILSSVEESKTFTFDLCKSVPFNSGEQDIVIYSVDEDGYVFCAPYIEENIKANVELSKILTKHCSHHRICFKDGSEPELGEMVLALYPEDEQWYRGTVIDKLEGSYFVNFVDYGNTEQLSLSSLCKMEEQFMELDVQAHMCSLTGFSMTDENKQKVYDEVKSFTVFNHPNPVRAFVEVIDNDIVLNIPEITSLLIEKQLVTLSDRE